MDLILWRHADAEDGAPDLQRQLTEKGRQQAQAMADWLRPRLPENLRILVSPALRARQTADALQMDYTIVDDVAPDVDVEQVLAAAEWPSAKDAVLVVGHQPTLGFVLSHIFPEQRPFSVKKGAIFWIVHNEDGGAQIVLQAAMSPEMLQR